MSAKPSRQELPAHARLALNAPVVDSEGIWVCGDCGEYFQDTGLGGWECASGHWIVIAKPAATDG